MRLLLILSAVLIGSPAEAADSVVDMTGRITQDCLVNNGFGYRFRYSHANQLCHTIEPTVSGDFESANMTWIPVCKQGPTDNSCPWPAGNCCVYCGFSGDTHTSEGTKGKAMAPGSYKLTASASPFVEGGTPISLSFGFSWSPSGNINSILTCALDGAGVTLQPNESWSMTLIIPDLNQTTRLEMVDGDGQRTLPRGILSRPLRVRVSGTNNVGETNTKEGFVISWTVRRPDGGVYSQFTSETGADGISAVTVPLGESVGTYSILAECGACIANREVTFTGSVITVNEATNLVLVTCDGTGQAGSRATNPMKVRALNTVTGTGRGGLSVGFSPTGVVSVNPGSGVTAAGSGIAFTAVQFSKVAGAGTVTATCSQCQGNQSVACSYTTAPDKPRPPDLPPKIGGGGDPPNPGGGGDFRLEMRFQAQQPRAGAVKTIFNPNMDRIGVIEGDSVRFSVLTTPQQQLQDGDVSWQGETSGTGLNLLVSFFSPGFRQQRVTVGEKEVQARIEVAPMPRFTEFTFCSMNVNQCRKAWKQRAPAIDWSQNVAAGIGRGARNGPQDAVRHAYWSALMAIRVSPATSEGVGTGHEGTNIANGENHNEPVMDLGNNAVGRQIAQTLLNTGRTSDQIPDAEIQDRVLDAFDNGQLTIMDEGGENSISLSGLLRQSR